MTSPQDQASQVPPTRSTGPESATGAALESATKEIPTGEDRGSTTPIVGDIRPDSEREAQGAQTEPARFTSNGQLPHDMVPSPSGVVPVGAVATSQEDAKARVEAVHKAHDEFVQQRRARSRRLDEATVNRLTGAELRAIGEQRGYQIGNALGTRASRRAFLDAQDKDQNLDKPASAPQPTPTSPTPQA